MQELIFVLEQLHMLCQSVDSIVVIFIRD